MCLSASPRHQSASCTCAMLSRKMDSVRRIRSGVITSVGDKMRLFPNGRTISPRSCAAAATRPPISTLASKDALESLSFTNSIPIMK